MWWWQLWVMEGAAGSNDNNHTIWSASCIIFHKICVWFCWILFCCRSDSEPHRESSLTHCPQVKNTDTLQITFSNAFSSIKKSALVQAMAWHHRGAKPLPESMLTQFTDAYMCRSPSWPSSLIHICATRAQWVNSRNSYPKSQLFGIFHGQAKHGASKSLHIWSQWNGQK